MATKPNNPVQVIPQMVDLLYPYSNEEKSRIIEGTVSFLGLNSNLKVRPVEHSTSDDPAVNRRDPVFSGHREMSPKEFLKGKDPQTDIDRVVCLAYYLTHYRDEIYFKTINITNLNTEAAQRKFSNATSAVRNASARGYLAPAPQKTQKQISAIGEQYVDALPDQQKAKAVRKNAQSGRARKKKRAAKRKAQRG